MFKNVMKFAFLFMMGAVLFNSGCGTDPVIEPEPEKNPPTLALVNFQGDAIADTMIVESAANYQVFYLKAAKGTGDMKTLTISADGVNIDYVDSLTYKLNETAMSSNPVLIVAAADKAAFKWEMWLKSTAADYDYHNYEFVVEDVNGKTAKSTVVLKLKEPVVDTSDLVLDGASDFVFYNNKGQNAGGIDVRDGSAQKTAASANEHPHIKDNGGDPWKKTISAIPGTSGFAVSIMATTNVDFDSILKQSEIQAIFDAGTMVPSDGESAPISAGDIFAVRVITGVDNQVTTISLLKFSAVSDVAGSNDDMYTVNIKR